jgi:hypothetical protein
MSDRSHGDGPDRQPTRVTLFLFATGIENRDPTIQNSRVRRDQMEECGHYQQWQRDFELLEDLNIRFLRYGPRLHKTFLGQRRYGAGAEQKVEETSPFLAAVATEPWPSSAAPPQCPFWPAMAVQLSKPNGAVPPLTSGADELMRACDEHGPRESEPGQISRRLGPATAAHLPPFARSSRPRLIGAPARV